MQSPQNIHRKQVKVEPDHYGVIASEVEVQTEGRKEMWYLVLSPPFH